MSTELTEGSERAAPGLGDAGRTGLPRRFWRWCGRHPRAVWAAGLALAALVLFLLYLRDAQTIGQSSDSGGISLQAWDLWHGNPILRGWWLSDECFYAIDLPMNAVVQMVVGLRPVPVHIYAAVDYVLVLLLAALLARGRARGRQGIVRMLLTVGIMLAPSTELGSRILLQGPDHVGTQIAVLATFLVIDRAPQRWWAPVAVGVLLTVAQVNDVQATFSAAAAVGVACGVRACAEVARWQRPPRERWYDASLVVAAVVSFALAHLIVAGIHAAGGFYLPGPKNGLGFAPISAMPAQYVGDRLQRPYLVRRRLHRAADGDQRHFRAAAPRRGRARVRGAVDRRARVLHPDGPGQPDARGRHGLHPDSGRVRPVCGPGHRRARHHPRAAVLRGARRAAVRRAASRPAARTGAGRRARCHARRARVQRHPAETGPAEQRSSPSGWRPTT